MSLRLVPVPGGDGGPIWIGATEIPWEAYDLFVFGLEGEDRDAAAQEADALARPSKPYVAPDRGFGHNGWPAISMSFQGAAAFCEWLSELTGRRFRLPAEDEWERACRGGSAAAWSSGSDPASLGAVAWYAENSGGTTHPVGQKAPNAFGLHDTHGNAAEWCVGGDGQPVVCGGSFQDAADALRCDARRRQEPSWNASDPQIPKSRWWLTDAPFVGFRVVMEP